MGRTRNALFVWIAAVLVAGVFSIPSARPGKSSEVASGGSFGLEFDDTTVPELTTITTDAPVDVTTTTAAPDGAGGTTTTTLLPGIELPDPPDLPLPPDGGVVVPPATPQPKTAYAEVWSIDNPPPPGPPGGIAEMQQRKPPVPLIGTVTDEVGLPVPDTCVEVTSTAWIAAHDGKPEDRGPGPYTARTNAIGQYSLKVVPWQYRVDAIDCREHVTGTGHQPGWRWVNLWGYDRGVVDVPVTPGAALRVKVLTAPGGSPIADRCIQVVSEAVVTLIGAMGNIYTGDSGEVLITGLPPGVGRVVATPDCEWAASTDGSSQEFLDLVVGETHEIELHPYS